jgi:antitoxin component of RelBE/YafQ-DinJ toxin-antitoxin module
MASRPKSTVTAKRSRKPVLRRLSIPVSDSLQKRIRKVAKDQSLPVSVFVAKVLEENVSSRTGRITDRMLRRLDELRAEFKTPLLRDSADVIREMREERAALI